MNTKKNTWSKELQEITRTALLQGTLSYHPEKGYCLKRITEDNAYEYGAIPVLAALSYDFSVHLYDPEGPVIPYTSVDDLIRDGWALD